MVLPSLRGAELLTVTEYMASGPGMETIDQTTHFGFRDVAATDKQTLVNDVFNSVAQRYDLMNDLMSAGLHRVWKAIMITALNPPRGESRFAMLNVAGGTGAIVFRAAGPVGS